MTLAPQHQTTLEVTFPASLASVAEARRHLAEWLHGAGVADPDLHDDLALVLSELAANAARAAQVHESTFSVQAAVQDGAVVLRVGNPADVWVPPTPAGTWTTPCGAAAGGCRSCRRSSTSSGSSRTSPASAPSSPP